MSLIDNIHRYSQLHLLINRGATGNGKQLAIKMGITERQVYNYLQELREMNIPISYDPVRETYYYTQPVRFEFVYGVVPLTNQELSDTDGGSCGASLKKIKNNWLTEILFQ
jgi:predicted DNA-binding transcriptional regulator YafY